MFFLGFISGWIVIAIYYTLVSDKKIQKLKEELEKNLHDQEYQKKLILDEAELKANEVLSSAEKIKSKLLKEAEKEIEQNKKLSEKNHEREITRLNNEKNKIHNEIASSKEQVEKLKNLQFEKLTYHIALEEVTNNWISKEVDFIINSLTPSNLQIQFDKFSKIVNKCSELGLEINSEDIHRIYKNIQTAHAEEVLIQKNKEEQSRIKEIMREEQRIEKTRKEELKKIEFEQKEIENRKKENESKMIDLQKLEDLKKLTEDQLNELQELKLENARIEEELRTKERAKSMAEQTKAGNVYIISNIGSFGENVYKVGMTRRLIPEDRIKELGDASVPFPFDVHAMIPSENAPELESKLHEELWKFRINYVNSHKEFFKLDLLEIKNAVIKHCNKEMISFLDTPPATQWRESLQLKEMGLNSEYNNSVEIDDEDSEDKDAA